jgi:hypothetical protein
MRQMGRWDDEATALGRTTIRSMVKNISISRKLIVVLH